MKKFLSYILSLSVIFFALSVVPVFANTFTDQMSIGTRSASVTQLQTTLAAHPDLYPEGLVTGYYGSLTAQAVTRFQKTYELPPMGRVDAQTLALLNKIFGTTDTASISVTSGACKPGDIYNTQTGALCSPAMITSIITVGNITPTRADVSWTTDKPSTTKILFATAPMTIGSNALMLNSNSLSTSHMISLTQLATSTTYYFSVASTDANGVTITSNQSSFTTTAK